MIRPTSIACSINESNAFRIQISYIQGHIKLRSQLSAGTLCDCQKSMELNETSSLESFCDVRHAGNGSAPNLVLQSVVCSEFSLTCNFVNFTGEFTSLLPGN